MPAFTLKIEIGNDAMKTDEDIAGALEQLAANIRNDGLFDRHIRDINGNTVGYYEVLP